MDTDEKSITEDFLYGIAEKELDEPIPELERERKLDKDRLELVKIKQKENTLERKEKRYYTAFRLIVGCLIMLGIIYLIDMGVSIAVKGEVSSLTKDILEVIKTLLFTLSGYLFARKENEA